ncbi:uncharacterized protein LOC119080320 [Bradysia coprophila]|uniref:uncharacterized protein LOC119080320 n=1 Tax=Bradysia coprophila TaxID=38358 RepID=UPI00187DBBC4|nr:uncharacterized protein LOC119080320 [Bradysia coprophila]
MIALIILSVFIPQFLCESVVLLDLAPEEAQKLIAGRSLAVNYARKLDEGPLSASPDRGNRKFYHNGKVIDNPNDYVQRTYEASQFHAQDGLGRSMFGYSDWNQGRLEARNANGEVRGSYQYVDPFGEDVIVNYWSDSLGFHQMDNRPKFVMSPVTETPEVQAAREAHEKAWAAAAAAARVNPDPMSDIYNANSNKLDEEQSEADQAMEIKQGLSRYPNLAYTNQIEEEDEEGAFSHDSVVVESTGEARDNSKLGKIRIENEDDEVEPSNPRGFYYSFEYPVHLILGNSDDRQQRSVLAEKGTPKSTETDISKLSSPLEAEVADYKIVKRSENSKDAGLVSEKNIEKADTVTVVGKNSESQGNVETPDDVKEIEKKNPKPISSSTHPNSKTVEAQIPVFVKVESEDQSSESILSEMELKRLATNADVIDAVHDAQIHRHH